MKNIKKIIKENVSADKIIFQRNGNIKAKRFYFYTFGNTAEKFADKIRNSLRECGIEIEIVDKSDNWNAWPKNSWFEVIFRAKN